MNQRVDESIRTRIVHPKILYFGTPIVLLTTLNEDGTSNITPMSSAWALGNRIVLGLGEGGHGLANLRRHGECVVNLPDPSLWKKVEALAVPMTGVDSSIRTPRQIQNAGHFHTFIRSTRVPV